MQRRTFLTGLAAGVSAGAGGIGRAADDGPSTPSADGPPATESATAKPRSVVIGRTFRPLEGCVEPGTAAAELTDSSVAVTGGLRGPTGCSVPALEDVSYDVAADRLTVSVATEETGEACTQMITELAYRLELRFDGGPPGTVAIVHDGVDGRREVARERIGSA